MKPILLVCLCLTSLGCAASDGFDNRNFAIDTYFPTTNEIQLAEERARNYWNRNASRFGPEPRYLAVEASTSLGPAPGLYPKLISSETTASFLRIGELSFWLFRHRLEFPPWLCHRWHFHALCSDGLFPAPLKVRPF